MPGRASSAPLFDNCKIMPIKDRIKYRTSCLIYKAINNLTPQYFSDMFTDISDVSSRNTRLSTQRNILYVPRAKLAVTSKCIRHDGSVIFNGLSESVRSAPSLNVFKSNYIREYVTSRGV